MPPDSWCRKGAGHPPSKSKAFSPISVHDNSIITNMSSFDKCKHCGRSFSLKPGSARVPIQGTCSCQVTNNTCRACVTKLHSEQSQLDKPKLKSTPKSASKSNVVFCLECKKIAFEMDNLIVNMSLCSAISSIRKLRTPNEDDFIEIDNSPNPAPRATKVKPRRSARHAVPPAIVKHEDASQGMFKCPRGCKQIIITSEGGCNVVTCVGHSRFRSMPNPRYCHPNAIYFCVHCKVECDDNYSTCGCPKRKDSATRKRVLEKRNEYNKKNPIVLYPDNSPEKPLQVDSASHGHSDGSIPSTKKRKKVTAGDTSHTSDGKRKKDGNNVPPTPLLEQNSSSHDRRDSKSFQSQKSGMIDDLCTHSVSCRDAGGEEDSFSNDTDCDKEKSFSGEENGTPGSPIGGVIIPQEPMERIEQINGSLNNAEGSSDRSEVTKTVRILQHFHPLREIIMEWIDGSSKNAEVSSDRRDMCMDLLFDLLKSTRRSSNQPHSAHFRTDSTMNIYLTDVLKACEEMKVEIPENSHDALFPIHKLVYGTNLTLSELACISAAECEEAAMFEGINEVLDEFESTRTSLKPLSEDIFDAMVEAARTLLAMWYDDAEDFDIDNDEYSWRFKNCDLFDFVRFLCNDQFDEKLKPLFSSTRNATQDYRIVPCYFHTSHKKFYSVVKSSWRELFENENKNSFSSYPLPFSTSAVSMLQQIVETVAFGDQRNTYTSVCFSNSKGIKVTFYRNDNGTFSFSECEKYLENPKKIEQDRALRRLLKEKNRDQHAEKTEEEKVQWMKEVEDGMDYLQKLLRFVKKQMCLLEGPVWLSQQLHVLYKYLYVKMQDLEDERANEDVIDSRNHCDNVFREVLILSMY